MTKSLFDISWNVTEEEYRADPAISYSTLAKYERTGFAGLKTLEEHVETVRTVFGSAVDAIITGGNEEFCNRFTVGDFEGLTDSISTIVKTVHSIFGGFYSTLDAVPEEDLFNIIEQSGYQPRWTRAVRINKILSLGSDYYEFLTQCAGKTVLNTKLYNDVIASVQALKTSPATFWYFKDTDDQEPLERLYQLKFKAELNGIQYRCMFDELIVDHFNKTIQPVDLKTSNSPEFDFPSHFVKWGYNIQNRLYSRILMENLKKDEYFKDFVILNYVDIVVNETTLTPLVWLFTDTFTKGTLTYGANKQIEMRDPEVIGKELYYYLTEKPQVPLGISITEPNDLVKYLNQMK